jgi:hypothetical protein
MILCVEDGMPGGSTNQANDLCYSFSAVIACIYPRNKSQKIMVSEGFLIEVALTLTMWPTRRQNWPSQREPNMTSMSNNIAHANFNNVQSLSVR